MNKTVRPSIACYTLHFLSPSMTFIHRQLESIKNDFDVVVLTPKRDNANLFPCKYVYVQKYRILEKVVRKILRSLNVKYSFRSKSVNKYWEAVLIENKVKLIHAHFGESGLEIFKVAKKLKLPLLVTFHGYDASMLLNNKAYVRELKKLFSYATVITVSEYMKSQLIKIGAPEDKVLVHYIGVPMEVFKHKPHRSLADKYYNNKVITFLQVSNFVEKKGHVYTIKAFKQFLSFYPHAMLILVGDGKLKSKMEALSAEFGISEKVVFKGHLDTEQVKSEMQISDIFLHHSIEDSRGDKEGIPTVIMEAMASGLPVISTFSAGIPELIQDNVTGYLVDEKDVSAYVKKMKYAIKSNEPVGIRATQYIKENFNMNVQNSHLKDLYRERIE